MLFGESCGVDAVALGVSRGPVLAGGSDGSAGTSIACEPHATTSSKLQWIDGRVIGGD